MKSGQITQPLRVIVPLTITNNELLSTLTWRGSPYNIADVGGLLMELLILGSMAALLVFAKTFVVLWLSDLSNVWRVRERRPWVN